MNIDAMFFSALLKSKRAEYLISVPKEWVQGIWQEVHEFCTNCLQDPITHALPCSDTVIARFSVLLVETEEQVEFFIEVLRERQAKLEIETRLQKDVAPLLFGEKPKPFAACDAMLKVASQVKNKFKKADVGNALDFINDIEPRIKDYSKRKALKGVLGISYPFAPLNESTGGLIGGEASVFLARSGIGKTWFMVQCASCALKQGKSVLFLSQEMYPIRVSMRLDSFMAGIPANGFRKGVLTSEQEIRLAEHYTKIASREENFLIYGPKDIRNLASLEAILASRRTEIDLLIWDCPYLLIRNQEWSDRADFVYSIKRLLEDYNLPGLLSWQFNKSVKGVSSRDSIDQTGASLTDAIITDVDNAFSMYQDAESIELNQMHFCSLKTRDGLKLKDMTVLWNVDAGRFEVLSWDIPGVSSSRSEYTKTTGSKYQV